MKLLQALFFICSALTSSIVISQETSKVIRIDERTFWANTYLSLMPEELRMMLAKIMYETQIKREHNEYSEIRITAKANSLMQAALDPHGKIVVFIDSNALLIYTMKGALIAQVDVPHIYHAIFNTAGDRILTTGLTSSNAQLWTTQGTTIATFATQDASLVHTEFNKTDTHILTVSNMGIARIWDAQGVLVATIPEEVANAQFNNAGTQIISRLPNGITKIWRNDGTIVATFSEPIGQKPIQIIINNPDDTIVTLSEVDSTPRLWNNDGSHRATLSKGTSCATFNQKGDKIITASHQGTITVWHTTGKIFLSPIVSQSPIDVVGFNETANILFAASRSGTVRLWDTAGTMIAECSENKGRITTIGLNPIYNKVFVTTIGGTVSIYNFKGTQSAAIESGPFHTNTHINTLTDAFVTINKHTISFWHLYDLSLSLTESLALLELLSKKNSPLPGAAVLSKKEKISFTAAVCKLLHQEHTGLTSRDSATLH